jgi:hypothetical protein
MRKSIRCPPYTQPVVASRAFELFDVTAELLLQELKTVADVLSKFIGKSAELFARFLRYEQLIDHHRQCT